MDEFFLQYIWRFQNFDHRDLSTTDGSVLQVIHPGDLNYDSGPDFFNARIKMDDVLWTGNIEIHTDAKEWYSHGHERDKAYDNVILHVVWVNGKLETRRNDGSVIPTLQLNHRVSSDLLLRYSKLTRVDKGIPCQALLHKVKDILVESMLDSVMVRRLERKSAGVIDMLGKTGGDWEETTYRILASNFGFKINTVPFELLSRALPLRVLRKHADRPIQMEALMFGVAGFLEGDPLDAYHGSLVKEFEFLSAKYELKNAVLEPHLWKFSRIRPANFPTRRLAQFTALLGATPNLFNLVIQQMESRPIIGLLGVQPPDYWKEHYHFGMQTGRMPMGMGEESIRNICINTLAPLLVAYGRMHDDQTKTELALNLLGNLKAERNRIIHMWKEAGVEAKNAFQSQALLELNNEYCMEKRCIQCKIGAFLMEH